MADALDEARQRVSDRFLGTGGIHAVGVRRSAATVVVYRQGELPAAEREALEAAVRKAAAPARVVFVEGERARLL